MVKESGRDLLVARLRRSRDHGTAAKHFHNAGQPILLSLQSPFSFPAQSPVTQPADSQTDKRDWDDTVLGEGHENLHRFSFLGNPG